MSFQFLIEKFSFLLKKKKEKRKISLCCLKVCPVSFVLLYIVSFNAWSVQCYNSIFSLFCAVHPISWARSDDSTALQLGKPGLSELLLPVDNPVTRPAKKVKRALAKEMRRSSLTSTEPPAIKLERCFDQYEK